MKVFRKILIGILALFLFAGISVCASATAEGLEYIEIPITVNPEYADILADEITAWATTDLADPASELYAEPVYTDVAAAADLAREYMKARSTEFNVYVKAPYDPELDRTAIFYEIFDLATAHTGDPKGGDYILRHYKKYGGGISTIKDGDYYHITYTFRMEYYTNTQQELELDEAVEKLLDALDLFDKSPYEKVKGVYDYITHNVTYDYDGLNDATDMLEYTAYDALINKAAVCQGYSSLLYRLLLELGIDNRYVNGTADNGVTVGRHGWNIIKLGKKYYFADSTWDASYADVGLDYAYFLLGETNFSEDHFMADEFTSASFRSQHPISATDYVKLDPFTVAFARLNLANEINMQFAFAKNTDVDVTGAYAEVVKDYVGYESVTQIIEAKDWMGVEIDGVTHYVVSFSGVAAKEMADAIHVTVYNAEGEAISNVWNDSIKGYIMRNFDDVSEEEQKLYVDMLCYGAAAQIFFNYDAENLATADLTDEQKALASTSIVTENNQVPGDNFLGTRLNLESRIELQMAFSNIDSAMRAEYSFADHYGQQVTGTVNGSEFMTDDTTPGMIVVVNRQVLADAREEVTVKVYNADGELVAGAVDSVESYVHRNQNSTQMSAAEKYLHKRILCFADSAYKFFHE